MFDIVISIIAKGNVKAVIGYYVPYPAVRKEIEHV